MQTVNLVTSHTTSQLINLNTMYAHVIFSRLNRAISARSQSFFLYSEPIYRMSKYYRDEMESRNVCYSSADMVIKIPIFFDLV